MLGAMVTEVICKNSIKDGSTNSKTKKEINEQKGQTKTYEIILTDHSKLEKIVT